MAVQPKIGITFAERAAPHPAPGPGRHHGGRDPRRRDRAERHPGGAHRPPGPLHPAHQRRRLRDLAPHRPRRRALPDQLDAGRRHGAAAGAPHLPALRRPSATSTRRRGATPCASPCPPGKRVKVKEGEGCHECRGTGYLGRTGIFEILPIDDAVKNLIVDAEPTRPRSSARRSRTACARCASRRCASSPRGSTTFEEVVRVTGL